MTLPTQSQLDRRQAAELSIGESLRTLRQATARALPPIVEPPTPAGIDVRPASTYEAVTRQMVESLQEDLREIKSRLNGLFFMIAGSILLDVVARVIGT